MAVMTDFTSSMQDTVLVDLAARFLEPAIVMDGSDDGAFEQANRLNLHDLVGDGHGEIVIEQSEGALVLELDEGVVLTGQGIAEAHVTSSGEEVGGLGFMSFKSGVTVYYPPSLDVSLTAVTAQG